MGHKEITEDKCSENTNPLVSMLLYYTLSFKRKIRKCYRHTDPPIGTFSEDAETEKGAVFSLNVCN